MTISCHDLVEGVAGLVTLPNIYLQINRIVDDPDCSMADIAKVASKDPSFTARLLQLANSALYSFPSSVETVTKAVSIIGTSQIRSLALSMSAVHSFDGLPNQLVSMENFWNHSLLCGLAAKHLAKELKQCEPDTMFTAGLLHDIGELIIFNRLPVQAKEALILVQENPDLTIQDAERQIMGFDHTEVGGALAHKWKLPVVLEECITYHHNLAGAKLFPRESALIHIANVVAQMAELDSIDPYDVAPVDPIAWEMSGLTEASIESVMHETQAEVAEIEKLFLGE